jgi:organic radical activating enzyme
VRGLKIFGNNDIVGKTFFHQAKSDELFVTSRFFTLQGEGPYRGQPAYFIRLAKCNLACSFCDTYFDSGEWRDFRSLLEESEQVIADFFTKRSLENPTWAQGYNKKIVLVITGGEPSLQKNLVAFLERAQAYFKNIQIESNGLLLIPNLPQETCLVVSPKALEKSGQVIGYFEPNKKTLDRADCLKFVMSSPDNSRYFAYSEIPLWAHEWAKRTNKPIFISPMNIYKQEPQRVRQLQDSKVLLNMAERSEINEIVSFWEPELLDLPKNQRNHEYAAEYCMKYGFILNLQIHLYAGLP